MKALNIGRHCALFCWLISGSALNSGDLQNVVKTIIELSESFEKRLHLLINDRDPVVVVRDVILVLLALDTATASPSPSHVQEISEALLHI